MHTCFTLSYLPPALLAKWLGPSTSSFLCGNTGMAWTLKCSQHTMLILEKRILLLILLGIKPTTFQSVTPVWHSIDWTILIDWFPLWLWQTMISSTSSQIQWYSGSADSHWFYIHPSQSQTKTTIFWCFHLSRFRYRSATEPGVLRVGRRSSTKKQPNSQTVGFFFFF